ncbi:hypothetical protein CONLIGDRAFT_195839 [Coniochaeta ligniaria NRRL 30616]|uniref:Uncharacterized protein n=1 Tax=Coniochaeta ligniaria NRRL 30616 TaxID=1408157 RepID=A0A1J7K120_9PEZI|nr:hypothetical protein CONLIGDRAFT_195839 [Coniochaeta ligniaria NRRL 30616]
MTVSPTDDPIVLFQRDTYSWLCKGMVNATGCPPDEMWLSTSHYRAVSPQAVSLFHMSVMPRLVASNPSQTTEKSQAPSLEGGLLHLCSGLCCWLNSMCAFANGLIKSWGTPLQVFHVSSRQFLEWAKSGRRQSPVPPRHVWILLEGDQPVVFAGPTAGAPLNGEPPRVP